MHKCAVILAAALTLAAAALHAAPVLLPLDTAAARGPNLLSNPGFEEVQDGLPVGWSSQNDDDWTLDTTGAHAGQRCVKFSKPGTEKLYWISQDVHLNQDRPRPLVVSAWSKADGAQGNRGPEYSVWVDLAYADGTSLWGQRATFQMGTHDWQYGEYSFVVTKPVKLATVHLLFRRGVSGPSGSMTCLAGADAGAGSCSTGPPHVVEAPPPRHSRGETGHCRRTGAEVRRSGPPGGAQCARHAPCSATVPGACGCGMWPPTGPGSGPPSR